MATQRTPPRASIAAAEELSQSTPHSKGASDNAEHATKHKQEDYAPFLEEDIATEVTITVEDFLRSILGIKDVEEVKKRDLERILNDPKFQPLMDKYVAADNTLETNLYHPFCELANWCLQKIGTKNVVFCRNDPQYVRDSDAERKPDVVNVDLEVVNKDGRDGVDNISLEGPKEAPFYWRELLSFWEFKIDDIPEEKTEKEASSSKGKAPKPKPDVVPQEQSTEKPLRRSDRNASKTPQSTSSPHQSTSETRAKRSGDSLESAVAKKLKKTLEHKLQCASYALELLSNGGLRSHVIGVLVSRNSLELLYYDRSLVAKSSPLRFTKPENRATFLAVLYGFGGLSRPRWGYPKLLKAALLPSPLPKEKPARGFWRDMYNGHTLQLENHWKLVLKDVIFRAHGLIGRGTVVVRATVENCPPSHDLKGKTVVVKWSWVPKTRHREAGIVENARKHAVQNGRPEMLNHLPTIYHSQEFDDLIPECQTFLRDHRPDAYEERILRLIVQEELQLLTELQDPGQLAKAFKQIFKCYRWLHDDVKTIHRDISVGNLMFKQIGDAVYGVLNDFDLAVQLDAHPRSTSKQRTGTKPYMAIDLLVEPPPLHLYRHDLESLLYVLVFLTCQIEGSPLADWKNETMKNLSNLKHVAITKSGFPEPKTGFEQFELWIIDLAHIFASGFYNSEQHLYATRVARRKGTPSPTFDVITLGGAVDFDKFEAVLEIPIVPS